MRHWFIRLLLVVALLVLGTGGYLYRRVTRYLDAPITARGGVIQVEIPKGATFREVVRVLAERGVVTDATVFELYGRYEKAGTHIKAGTYAIDRAWTPRALLERLKTGGLVPQVRLTLPEGQNRWQTADRLAALGLVDRAAFLEKVEAENLEGRLFPDTYWVKVGATLPEIVTLLTDRFDAVFADVLDGHRDAAIYRAEGEAQRQLLTLASLIESEARTDRDRKLVSRVFYNRLAAGMRLQTDPTCVYGPDTYQEKPHPRFCRDPRNRYSTYVIDGLPPTPIANPGRAALDAALRPAAGPEAEKLLYFVARRDGSGEHHFSATYAEHSRAVDQSLKSGPQKDP